MVAPERLDRGRIRTPANSSRIIQSVEVAANSDRRTYPAIRLFNRGTLGAAPPLETEHPGEGSRAHTNPLRKTCIAAGAQRKLVAAPREGELDKC